MPPKSTKAKAAPKGGASGGAKAAVDPEAETERRFLVEQCKVMKAQRIFEDAQLVQFHEEKVREEIGSMAPL